MLEPPAPISSQKIKIIREKKPADDLQEKEKPSAAPLTSARLPPCKKMGHPRRPFQISREEKKEKEIRKVPLQTP